VDRRSSRAAEGPTPIQTLATATDMQRIVRNVAVRVVARAREQRLDCADPADAGARESGRLGFFQDRDRSKVAVVVTSDGRRVNVPLRDLEPQGVSPLDLLRSLLAGLESLLGLLITGSRRENGGTRRNERH
jgi:hypothetical protein